jgi:glycosyltransferase involved in cell wall biosynthesis
LSDARLPPRVVKVRVFHQTDPAGTIPGGIDTFIRGIIKAAPHDIEISVVGLTTNPEARPVGHWSSCELGDRKVPFFPVGRYRNPRGRSFVPLSVQLTAGIARYYRVCSSACDVLEFHRVEPAIVFLRDHRPKNAFVHQNMADAIQSNHSDLRWKRLPWLFFWIEGVVLRTMDSVFGVRADAIEAYRSKYPDMADRFHFIPTWMNPDEFFPLPDVARQQLRAQISNQFGLRAGERFVISVGRLDSQKDPLLLVDGFASVARVWPDVRLIIVGDGVLRGQIEARIAHHQLADRIILAGLRTSGEVAKLLQVADCFVLTSAYEGMPMSVLEALGSGLPVVTTRVGEVERVVRPGINGEILSERTPESLRKSLERCLDRTAAYRGGPCLSAVSDFIPHKVLQPVYEAYRRLGRAHLS